MAIPNNIKIKNNHLPASPGVYLMRDSQKQIIYIGKATSLKNRVSSYFLQNRDPKTASLIKAISQIDYLTTDSVLEAVILEAELIKKYQPKYNIKDKDDRSWAYLVITKSKFPRPVIKRALELKGEDLKKFKYVFGPFKSQRVIEDVLKIIRKIFPYSDCTPDQGRPCFYYQIKQCPGVCLGLIDKNSYAKNIRRLALLFQGKKQSLIKRLNSDMQSAAKKEEFAEADKIKYQLNALKHIQDVSLLKREYLEKPFLNETDIFSRIEGYDISNISGTNSVGSLVVFVKGEPQKKSYRKFKIKTISGVNDVGMLKEVLSRRLAHSTWPLPDLFLIDGGKSQVNAARAVLSSAGLYRPIVGIAKGPKRKNNIFIISARDKTDQEKIKRYKSILIRVRDEAHRFAISYHRYRRSSALRRP